MTTKLELHQSELEFLRLALNEAMDNTKNQGRYKIYDELLNKLS